MSEAEVRQCTSWLRDQPDLTSARIAHQMRFKGVDPKTLWCAKMFPDLREPTGGVVVTPEGSVFQFAFNRGGMVTEMAVIDEWLNITSTYKDHPWRDEIMTALAMAGNHG